MMDSYMGPGEELLHQPTPMRLAPGQWIMRQCVQFVLRCTSNEKQKLQLQLEKALVEIRKELADVEKRLNATKLQLNQALATGNTQVFTRHETRCRHLMVLHKRLADREAVLDSQLSNLGSSSHLEDTVELLRSSNKYATGGTDDLEDIQDVLDEQQDASQQLLEVDKVFRSATETTFALSDEAGGGFVMSMEEMEDRYQSLFAMPEAIPRQLSMEYDPDSIKFPAVPTSAPPTLRTASRKTVLMNPSM